MAKTLFRPMRPDIKVLASPDMMANGHVTAVGLDPIRSDAGDKWLRMRLNVYARFEMLLKEKLGPSDAFIQIDEANYLVTTPSTDLHDAQVFCLNVAYNMMKDFLTQPAIDDICLYTAALADNDQIALHKIPSERIHTLAVDAGIKEGAQKPTDFVSSVIEKNPSKAPDELAPNFIPVWDAKKEAISCFICAPKNVHIEADERENELPDFGEIELPKIEENTRQEMTPQARLKAEIAAIYYGFKTLATFLEKGHRFLLMFPMSFETIGSPKGRMEFTSALRELPAQFRPYILFHILDLPHGIAQSRLSDLITSLKPFSKAVIAEIPVRAHSHAAYHGIGLQAVSLALWREKLTKREVEEEIAKLCLTAKHGGLTTYISGIVGHAALSAACASGAHLLSGPYIHRTCSEPFPMVRVPMTNIGSVSIPAS